MYAQYDDPDNSLAAVGDALVDASEDTAVATVYRVRLLFTIAQGSLFCR